jgi:hypothetical protein
MVPRIFHVAWNFPTNLDSRCGNPVEVESSPTALAHPASANVDRSPRVPHIERSL